MDASGHHEVHRSNRELVLRRVFEASRRVVFKAWTEPQRLAQWWGPNGFTNPVCEFDARPDGAIRIDMRGPDGVVYPMTGTVREIVAPDRLTLVCTALDEQRRAVLEVLNTATFTEHAGKTTLTVRARVLAATAEADPYLAGMEQGWSESLDRLDTLLRSAQTAAHGSKSGHKGITGTADREIVISRVLEAPRELVWDAWTNPEQVVRWWGPRGFTTTIETMDLRPGGEWRHVMHGPDGADYPNRSVFKEIVKPERIAFSHGGGRRGARDATFEATWTFDELDRRQTKLTMRLLFPSAEARERAVQEYGAIEGGRQTLERLAEHIRTKP